jgi:hypothetical protein
MREFTLRHWQDTLARVFAKAAIEPGYRETCLHHPRAAVAEVSDIDLPAYFKFDFVDDRAKITYCFALPPLQRGVSEGTAREVEGVLAEVTDFLMRCTEPTTGL